MHKTTAGATLALLALVAPHAAAQVRASERAEVRQTVDGTVITVNYSRPRLRGRTTVFGTQVPWGEIWTPGANDATTLAVSRDVRINGQPVPKGKYSVWIPMTQGPWTLVLDPDTTLFHENGPKERPGQFRLSVKRETAPLTEVLTWWFPDVRASGTRLVMQWETTAVALDIAVTPTQSALVDPAVGRRIEGRYDFRLKPMPPPKDTSVTAPPPLPTKLVLSVRQDGQVLRARMDPPIWPGYEDFVLVRRTDDWFVLAESDADGIKELWDWSVLEFTVSGGHATRVEMREENDAVMATGTRMP